MRTKVQLVNKSDMQFLSMFLNFRHFSKSSFYFKKVVIEKGVLCEILVFFLT